MGDSDDRKMLSVGEVAKLFGMSPMTIYRAIQANQFPAIKIRGRYVIPAKAIDAMVEAAIKEQRPVDAMDFVVTRKQ